LRFKEGKKKKKEGDGSSQTRRKEEEGRKLSLLFGHCLEREGGRGKDCFLFGFDSSLNQWFFELGF